MSRVRSSGRVPPYKIDTDWPHQVALPDDLCCQPNYETIANWLQNHSLSVQIRQVISIWTCRTEEETRLHCFRTEPEAEAFRTYFGGTRFFPSRDREKGLTRGAWRRDGEYVQMTESGPLRLHPVFMRGPKMAYD